MKVTNEPRSRFEQMNSKRSTKKYSYCFFDYLYYRLYVTYKKHNDPPRFSACCVFAATFDVMLLFLCKQCFDRFLLFAEEFHGTARRTNGSLSGYIVLRYPLLPAVHPEADCRHTAEIQRQQVEQDYPHMDNIYFSGMGSLGRDRNIYVDIQISNRL